MMRKKHNFFSVFKFTYSQGLKAKWFLVSTLCGLLVMLAVFNADNIQKLLSGSSDTPTKIAIVNQIKSLDYNDLLREIQHLSNQFDYKEETDVNAISKDLENGKSDYDALIVFTGTGNNSTVYYNSKFNSINIKNQVTNITDNMTKAMYAENIGLNQEQINSLLKTSMVSVVNYSNNKISPQEIAVLFILILFFIILLYGSVLSNSVVEEKTNRIVETLLCYVKPWTLMFGKIIGNLSLALTQILLFLIAGFLMSKIFVLPEIVVLSVNSKLLTILIINVLLGYLIYACLFVASESFAENAQDSTSLMMPATILILLSYVIPFPLISSGDVSTLNILSYIPFLSPVSFMALASITEITTVQIILNVLVQIIDIIIVGLICSKFYIKGICGSKLVKGMKSK